MSKDVSTVPGSFSQSCYGQQMPPGRLLLRGHIHSHRIGFGQTRSLRSLRSGLAINIRYTGRNDFYYPCLLGQWLLRGQKYQLQFESVVYGQQNCSHTSDHCDSLPLRHFAGLEFLPKRLKTGKTERISLKLIMPTRSLLAKQEWGMYPLGHIKNSI